MALLQIHNEIIKRVRNKYFLRNLYKNGKTKEAIAECAGEVIGANAVLSPGMILEAGSMVKRLELVEQAGP